MIYIKITPSATRPPPRKGGRRLAHPRSERRAGRDSSHEPSITHESTATQHPAIIYTRWQSPGGRAAAKLDLPPPTHPHPPFVKTPVRRVNISPGTGAAYSIPPSAPIWLCVGVGRERLFCARAPTGTYFSGGRRGEGGRNDGVKRATDHRGV